MCIRDRVIAEDPEIGIVVETMGGVEPAFTFVKAMLEAGKQVATSNKNLVAAKGAELIKVARDQDVYKRQLSMMSISRLMMESLFSYAEIADPVSYTHLDVYKRQI